jgi:hypothetical protein
MLLSNLTKIPAVCSRLLALKSADSNQRVLDALVDVFVRGDSRAVNQHATFDFLASVFANISMVGSLLVVPGADLTSSFF